MLYLEASEAFRDKTSAAGQLINPSHAKLR